MVVGCFAVASIAGVGGQAGARGPGEERTPAVRHHTVRSGETIWSIAVRLAGERDPRPTVDRLIALNDLSGATITPGQRLTLPTSS